jgi:hypothetical protein
MPIARYDLNRRLAAGELPARVGTFPGIPLAAPRPFTEIEREIEEVNWLRAKRPELSLVAAVLQVRRELGLDL